MRVLKFILHLPAGLALLLIRGYKFFISPLLGPRCRFYPSCSEYAAQAIGRFGFVKGTCMAAVRLVKCGPFHPGGHDPVPPAEGPCKNHLETQEK